MAERAAPDASEAYLVENYRPGLRAAGLKGLAARVREATDELEREGQPVRFVRATIVPADESLLCILEAASEELVHAAYARAEVPFERISLVLSENDGQHGAARLKGER